MAPSTPRSAAHYRRRILALGAFATGALYVIGAPIFNRRIEDDLERRVPAELADAGFGVVTAAFSGQDGTISCDAPLDDPEGARAAAFDVRGVRDVELDRSCRVNTAPTTSLVEATDDGSAERTEETDDSADGDVDTGEPVEDTADDEAVATTAVGLATVRDVVAANPDLAFLSVLLADVDIGGTTDAVTLFAPDNEAFDAMPADVLGRLQSDPELLARVLDHHVVPGAIAAADLRTGELVANDGSAIDVEVGDRVTVDGAPLIETDLLASNGIVHVVGALLLPDDLRLTDEEEQAAATVAYDGTAIVLSGVVASEVERLVLVDASVAAVGLDAVDDQLTVDPDTGVDAERAGRIATLVGALSADLVSGEVGFDGTELFARGIAAGAGGADAFAAAAQGVGVTAVVESPPAATEADAALLEAALNEFVAENPIRFEPSSAVLAESAFAVLDRIARDAQALSGVAITVEGHTDSDGAAAANLQLSQARADAVRSELVARGLDEGAVDAVGFGSEQPILVDGVEDKSASRRVEFRVVTS